jgi:hypothetical protein
MKVLQHKNGSVVMRSRTDNVGYLLSMIGAHNIGELDARGYEIITTHEHIPNCELGINWLDCPACVESYNETCAHKDIKKVPLWFEDYE